MRLVSFVTPAGPRCGVLVENRVVEVTDLLGGEPIRDVQGLVEREGSALLGLRAALAQTDVDRLLGPDLADVELLPPVLRPPTVRDHITFEDHATRQFTREIAEVWYRRPIHYYSNPAQLVGHEHDVRLPATERLDYELELAVVIGDEVSDLSPEQGLDHVVGFTLLNDWSARDLQADEMTYGLGPAKGKDFATSLGPWVVTVDEVAQYLHDGILDVHCEVLVNGEKWAENRSDSQRHTWGQILCHASQDSRLLPGDVLASGTVGGCSIGEALRNGTDAHYLRAGDRVELRAEGLGSLVNTITANPREVSQTHYRAASLPPMPQPITPPAAS